MRKGERTLAIKDDQRNRDSISVYIQSKPHVNKQSMDVEIVVELLNRLIKKALRLLEEFREINEDSGYIYYVRLLKLLYLIVPILTAMLIYQYIKYLLIYNAYQYEEFVRKRYGHMKKVTKQLRHLTKRYGSYYFCYMPLNHGTALPRTYSLFTAIKEVLINSNRPATRIQRTNLLLDLIHADHSDARKEVTHMDVVERELFDVSPDNSDPLSEFNLEIMNCSRELIIQGIKDFEVMSSLYRVMETVVGDADN